MIPRIPEERSNLVGWPLFAMMGNPMPPRDPSDDEDDEEEEDEEENRPRQAGGRDRAQAKAGEGHVVLLSGEAGVGKSRMTQVLLERSAQESHARLRYFCSPHHRLDRMPETRDLAQIMWPH
jgi:hypothetical protein